VFGFYSYGNPSAADASGVQLADEFFGQCLGNKGCLVDS
jgi:hypothetical protein